MTTRTMVGQEPSLFLLFSAIDSALSVTNHHDGVCPPLMLQPTTVHGIFLQLTDNEVLRRIF